MAVKEPTSTALETSLPPAPTSRRPVTTLCSWARVGVVYQPQRLQPLPDWVFRVMLSVGLRYPKAVPKSQMVGLGPVLVVEVLEDDVVLVEEVLVVEEEVLLV